jgi:hypothetical protein
VFSLAEILKVFLSETTKPIELWLCRNDHWVVLYYTCESFADRKLKMATMTRLSLTLDPQHQKHKSGREPSNEHYWQVWLKSVQRSQRRRFKCEKLTDGRLPMTKAHMAYGQVT